MSGIIYDRCYRDTRCYVDVRCFIDVRCLLALNKTPTKLCSD